MSFHMTTAFLLKALQIFVNKELYISVDNSKILHYIYISFVATKRKVVKKNIYAPSKCTLNFPAILKFALLAIHYI